MKLGILIAVIISTIALGAWFDSDRKTESFTVSWDSGELAQRRVSVEGDWKKNHPNVVDPQFSYYVSHGKVVAYFVNHY